MLRILSRYHMYSEHPLQVHTPGSNNTTSTHTHATPLQHHCPAQTAWPTHSKWMEFPTCFFKERNRKATSLCLLRPHRSYLAAVWSVFVHTASCHRLEITDVTNVYSRISYGTLKPSRCSEEFFSLKDISNPLVSYVWSVFRRATRHLLAIL